jgi:transglutaminase-like putative cysteine protease
MEKVHYSFTTRISFSEEIRFHSFLLRCTPLHLPFQKIISDSCTVNPAVELCQGTDSFGNTVRSGYIAEPHSAFDFTSEGLLSLDTYRYCEELNPLFAYPSEFTMPYDEINHFFRTIPLDFKDSIQIKVAKIGTWLHETFIYEQGITNVKPTANQAMVIGKGVCQDYAHIMITLCRLAGIPTRYVAGFMKGENYTHAWIEFYEAGIWLPYDPTNNRWIETGYIKLAHGRDYSDCPIERGVFSGNALQIMDVQLMVEETNQ